VDRLPAIAAADTTHEPADRDGDPERDPGSGTRLGDFTLLRRLGRGAQGEVYEARQESLGRLVALKVLPPYLTFSPDRVQRFRREAEAGGRLEHPNTVGVHAVGEFEGYHYIAQELVAGGRTLADRIAEARRQPELPRDWYEKTAQLFVQVADAVHAAHEAGIIHRDLKPGNILLTRDGQPKVADFGLAMVLDDLHRSRSGELIGTPFYMSPEQAAGARTGLDRRTDVFSLGSTLYEALTLQRPFEGETRETIVEQILLHDPRDPRRVRPSVPRDLAVICMKALEKRRERRYQTAAELADELRRWLRHEPIQARPPGLVLRGAKWVRRHPVPTAFAGVFVIVVALLVTTYLAGQDALAQRRKAEENLNKRQLFVTTLLHDVFEPSVWDVGKPGPRPDPSDPHLARIVALEQLAARVGPEAGLPEERCHLLTTAGTAYVHVSMFEEADRCLVAALDGARQLDPADPENAAIVARAALALGTLRRWTGRWDEAESLLAEARGLLLRQPGGGAGLACQATLELAAVEFSAGQAQRAESLLRSSIDEWSDSPETSAEPLLLRRQLGYLLMDDGQLNESRELLDPVYELSASIFPESEHAASGAVLAKLYDRLGRAAAASQPDAAAGLDARAEALFRESIDRTRAVRPERGEQLAQALANYGSFLSTRKRLDEAQAVLEEARDGALRSVGPDHYVTLLARNNLATLRYRQDRPAEAEAEWLEIIASDRRTTAPDPRPVLQALENLAKLCLKQERYQDARGYADELVARTLESDRDFAERTKLRDRIQAGLDRLADRSPQER